MRTVTIDVSALKNVRDAINQAIMRAKSEAAKVIFEFNGVVVAVDSNSLFNDVLRTYLTDHTALSMSKEKSGILVAPAALPVSLNQTQLTKFVGSIEKFMITSKTILDFLEDYCTLAAQLDVVDIHAKVIYDRLHEEGFYEHMYSGKSVWNDATKSAAFIIGKAMAHLLKDEVPNPVLKNFIEHWRELFAKHAVR